MLKHFTEDGFSLDTCVERAVLNSEFIREQVVLTKTLYCYVELSLIEERPRERESRKGFGYWECNFLIRSKISSAPSILMGERDKAGDAMLFHLKGSRETALRSLEK